MKRFQAMLNAFDNSHPGIVSCQGTVTVMLVDSWVEMQHGGPGITPADAAYKYGQNSIIANVYPQFYDALTNYADNHSLQADFTVTAITTDQGLDELLDSCLLYLNETRNEMPGSSPPREQPGFASALSVWEQLPMTNSADSSLFYLRVADDLRAADKPGYTTAVKELIYVASIPEMDVTSQQITKSRADLNALDSFFVTPGLN